MEFQKLRPWLVGAAALTFSLLPQAVQAADIQTYLDGRPLMFEVEPILTQGVTLVPMRDFLTALGADVQWNPAALTVTATLGDTKIAVQVGSRLAFVNDEPVLLPVSPELVDGHTMIPIRFVTDQLGYSICWDQEDWAVFVATRGEAVPIPIALADRGRVDRERSVDREATAEQEPTQARASDLGMRILELARAQIGAPYAYGGTSPDTGFDCSGLVTYISNVLGLGLPRTSWEQFEVGQWVDWDDLQPGDLVFFETDAPGASHVGIYDGGGGFIHAQSPEVGVKVTSMYSDWWYSRYVGARRVR